MNSEKILANLHRYFRNGALAPELVLNEMICHRHKAGIGLFDEVLTGELCATILEHFSQSDKKGAGEVHGPGGKRKKVESKVSIDLDVADLPKPIRDQIHDGVCLALIEYLNQFPSLGGQEFRTMGYKIQMYERDSGQFVWHCDATNLETYRRQIAMVLYLNTVELGGETEFYDQDVQIRPRQGSCIFFPPFWTHMHRGTIPRSDDKVVISSFFERVFAGDR